MKPQRQDMVGIEPHVDLSATMALLNSKSDKQQEEEDGQCKLSRPQRLPPEKRRHLQTIIAGSIRAPHRLKHAGKVSSDVCTHPRCAGARCDTQNLFWNCARHDEVRKPYTDKINSKLNWLKKNDKGNHKMIKQIGDTVLHAVWHLQRGGGSDKKHVPK